jgi:hypothetical protein
MTDMPDPTEEMAQLVRELVGDVEIYGITSNSQGKQLQARVFADGAPYLYTFELDTATGKYRLARALPLGQQKL